MNNSDKQKLKFGKLLFQNLTSNYLSTVIKLVSTIFLTYLLYTGLGEAFYGFWSLLWSVFIYSLLLDFGFGKAIEKYTAEASFSGNMTKFNSIVSTIFFTYFAVAFLIFAGGLILSFYLERIFNLQSDSVHTIEYYKQVFILFTLGVAIVFPTGIFPPILVGLQRSYLRNHVLIANKVIELAGVWYILHCGHSLFTLVIFTMALNLASNVAMAIMAFRLMSGLRISFMLVKARTIKYIADFSIFAYILTICDLVTFQTDRIVLSALLGVSSVAVYQIATKIPTLIYMMSTQFQSNLAPVAAILHKAGDKGKLHEAMFYSTRITVFICTGVFAVFIPLVRPILHVWLNIDDETTIKLSYIFISSTYIIIAFSDTAKHFLLMTGHHRFLTCLAFIESVSNLILSIVLVKSIGILGVAWGTLIPGAIISIGVIFPVAAHYSGNSLLSYFMKVYVPTILFAAPITLISAFISHSFPIEKWNLLFIIIVAAATGMLYILMGWLIYTNRREKIKLCSLLPGFIPRKLIALVIKSSFSISRKN